VLAAEGHPVGGSPPISPLSLVSGSGETGTAIETDGHGSSPKAGEPRIFEFVVHKKEHSEALGLDVKNRKGEMTVVRLLEDGAILRTNLENQARVPPGETLEPDDIIKRVNAVSGSNRSMLNQCKQELNLTFLVARLPVPPGPTP